MVDEPKQAWGATLAFMKKKNVFYGSSMVRFFCLFKIRTAFVTLFLACLFLSSTPAHEDDTVRPVGRRLTKTILITQQ